MNSDLAAAVEQAPLAYSETAASTLASAVQTRAFVRGLILAVGASAILWVGLLLLLLR